MIRAIVLGGLSMVLSAFLAFYVHNQVNQIEQPHRNRTGNKISKSKKYDKTKEDIENRTLKCSICTERCKFSQDIWFCNQCACAVHITDCLKKWVDDVRPECPSCENNVKLPLKYTCMCGRIENPRSDIYNPFSCGSPCSRCQENCHPGSCS